MRVKLKEVREMSGKRVSILVMAALVAMLVLAGCQQHGPVPPEPQSAGDVEALQAFWQLEYGQVVTAARPSPSPVGQRVAKAEPDEHFNGIGQPYDARPPYNKVNQGYPWGMTVAGDHVWIATLANPLCQFFGGYSPLGVAPPPVQTSSFVCEYALSKYSSELPAVLGDWRPPQAFVYNVARPDEVSEVPIEHELLRTTGGLRSAGTHGGIVFLAGPSFNEVTGQLGNGVSMFAFDADEREFLDAHRFEEYSDIRNRWLVVDDVLYTTVGNIDGSGSVLRWNGTRSNLFEFEVVGDLDGQGAELELHEGRLFVTTWNSLTVGEFAVGNYASLYMSPLIPDGGLRNASADDWEKVWQITDYEPDPVTATIYQGGPLVSFDGYLYWATINPPFVGAIQHIAAYGTSDPLGVTAAVLGAHRPTTVFRGRRFGSGAERVELLYGSQSLPVYVPGSGWQIVANNMGSRPLYGSAGYGNFFNAYTWSMTIHDGMLYAGTFDWSVFLKEPLDLLLHQALGFPLNAGISRHLPRGVHYGADLYRFPSARRAAEAISTDGLGNYRNYGIRNLISTPTGLYSGMSNPFNLLVDPDDDRYDGGWELIVLRQGSTGAPPPQHPR
jgi:hypothetical protein